MLLVDALLLLLVGSLLCPPWKEGEGTTPLLLPDTELQQVLPGWYHPLGTTTITIAISSRERPWCIINQLQWMCPTGQELWELRRGRLLQAGGMTLLWTMRKMMKMIMRKKGFPHMSFSLASMPTAKPPHSLSLRVPDVLSKEGIWAAFAMLSSAKQGLLISDTHHIAFGT
jgi:hypothetical protein